MWMIFELLLKGWRRKKCRVLRKVGEEMVAGRENYVRCDVMMNWRYLGCLVDDVDEEMGREGVRCSWGNFLLEFF